MSVGLTRVHRMDGRGTLEPVTASAGSRLGQRVTFVVTDETSFGTARNGGYKLADVLRRNLRKGVGRSFESTNAHTVGGDSVAERTFQAATDGARELQY